MSYSGLEVVTDPEASHLGGNISSGDPYTFSPRAWDYVIERFGIRSVMDLGSGCGNSALYFWRKGLQVVAVDGFIRNVDASLYPAMCHDLTTGPVRTRVDLVHCQEVVEHIDAEYLDNILDSMACGKVVMMTHALPGNDGYHHVNLQPPEYWINHMARKGLKFAEEDSRRVKELAKNDRADYLAKTGMVFINASRW